MPLADKYHFIAFKLLNVTVAVLWLILHKHISIDISYKGWRAKYLLANTYIALALISTATVRMVVSKQGF